MTHLLICLTAVLGADGDAATWTSFRNGGSSVTEAENVPITWSPEEGIAWQSELPGYGQSSPVVWEGTAIVTSVDGPMKERCVVTALDVKKGTIRWSESVEASARAPLQLSCKPSSADADGRSSSGLRFLRKRRSGCHDARR